MEEEENGSQNEESSVDHVHQAANRIILQEKLKYLKLEEKMKEIHESEILLKSTEILGIRERFEAAKSGKNYDEYLDEEQIKKEKISLREERDQLHKNLIKHKSLHYAALNSRFETQIQNAVYDSLQNETTLTPEVTKMMEHYQNNLTICRKYSDLLMITEVQEGKILELRQKYRILLQSIEDKWSQLSGLKPNDQPRGEELEALAKNVEKREDKLHLLISLLQNIISGSGEKWGKNSRIVEIMLLCDKVKSFLGGFGDISHDFKGLQLAREQTEERRPGPMDRFVSSTPR